MRKQYQGYMNRLHVKILFCKYKIIKETDFWGMGNYFVPLHVHFAVLKKWSVIARPNSSIIMALAMTNNKIRGLETDMQSLWLCFRNKQQFSFFRFTNSQCLHFSLNFCSFYMRFYGNNQHERRVTVSSSINNWLWILMREKHHESRKNTRSQKGYWYCCSCDWASRLPHDEEPIEMNYCPPITFPSSPATPVHKIS